MVWKQDAAMRLKGFKVSVVVYQRGDGMSAHWRGSQQRRRGRNLNRELLGRTVVRFWNMDSEEEAVQKQSHSKGRRVLTLCNDSLCQQGLSPPLCRNSHDRELDENLKFMPLSWLRVFTAHPAAVWRLRTALNTCPVELPCVSPQTQAWC